MSIANISLVDSIGGAPGDPVFADLVELDLDNAYPAGGYTTLATVLQDAIGKGKTILSVEQQNSPGTVKIKTKYDYDAGSLMAYLAERQVEGGLLTAPTNASAQLTGASGNTDWNVNLSHVLALLYALSGEVVAAADFDIHNGSIVDAGFVVGASIVAAIVVKVTSGTFAFDKVLGAAATTGSQVAPTAGEIATAMAAADDYALLGYTTLNRTADTTVTQSYDNTPRNPGPIEVADGADLSSVVDLRLLVRSK